MVKEINVVNTLLAKQVDGLVFLAHNLSDKIRAEFSRTRTPIVLAGAVDPEDQIPSVNIDYTVATKEVKAGRARWPESAQEARHHAHYADGRQPPHGGCHRRDTRHRSLCGADA